MRIRPRGRAHPQARAGETEDVQFDDLDATYDFGVAAFDNTQINRAVHAGVLHFTFSQ